MNVAEINMEELDIDLPNAKLAYTIIQSLLDGHEALSDLLVVMSHALDEDVLKATKIQIEGFTEQLKRLENA